MNQLGLFAGPHALARNSDHDSSKLAAYQHEVNGRARTQREECYAAVAKWPGSTARQLSELSGISMHVIGRRLPELADESKYVGGNTPLKRDAQPGRQIRWWIRRAL